MCLRYLQMSIIAKCQHHRCVKFAQNLQLNCQHHDYVIAQSQHHIILIVMGNDLKSSSVVKFAKNCQLNCQHWSEICLEKFPCNYKSVHRNLYSFVIAKSQHHRHLHRRGRSQVINSCEVRQKLTTQLSVPKTVSNHG